MLWINLVIVGYSIQGRLLHWISTGLWAYIHCRLGKNLNFDRKGKQMHSDNSYRKYTSTFSINLKRHVYYKNMFSCFSDISHNVHMFHMSLTYIFPVGVYIFPVYNSSYIYKCCSMTNFRNNFNMFDKHYLSFT